MDVINSFTNKLHKHIPICFTGQLFSGMSLCTYMAEQQRMVIVYSEPNYCIKCYQLANCKLGDMMIVELQQLIAKCRAAMKLKHVAFSYNISYNEANIKCTMLSGNNEILWV